MYGKAIAITKNGQISISKRHVQQGLHCVTEIICNLCYMDWNMLGFNCMQVVTLNRGSGVVNQASNSNNKRRI
jgi:hypothetical protein